MIFLLQKIKKPKPASKKQTMVCFLNEAQATASATKKEPVPKNRKIGPACKKDNISATKKDTAPASNKETILSASKPASPVAVVKPHNTPTSTPATTAPVVQEQPTTIAITTVVQMQPTTVAITTKQPQKDAPTQAVSPQQVVETIDCDSDSEPNRGLRGEKTELVVMGNTEVKLKLPISIQANQNKSVSPELRTLYMGKYNLCFDYQFSHFLIL